MMGNVYTCSGDKIETVVLKKGKTECLKDTLILVHSLTLSTGLVMSAITVIILVLYFVINTFVVEGLFVYKFAKTHSISEYSPFIYSYILLMLVMLH